MISKLIFGYKKPTEQYVLRPSCYAIIFNSTSSKIAVIQKRDRYFLPGGGIEGTETKDECLHRELLEELGWEIEIDQYIGNAMRYFFRKRRYLLFK
ncbi:8-oxo-dGTP pyrophosphatase MutT (NUDIX family) [Bacillus sp. TE9106W]